MKKDIETLENQTQEIEVWNIQKTFTGYGHWKITFDIRFKDEKCIFSHTTTDSMSIDELTEFRVEDPSLDELHEFMCDLWFSFIEEKVAEWVDEIIELKS
jgi:hypothetical protein